MERLRAPSRDRALARIRRLVGQHARARVCANASARRQRARAARHFPAAALELDWFYQFGASLLFPEHWQNIPRADPAGGTPRPARRLPSAAALDDEPARLAAARAWSVWEGATSSLLPNPKRENQFGAPEFALALARIEAHYFVNRGFFDARGAATATASDTIRADPGRDRAGSIRCRCPDRTAWELHRRWPEADLRVVVDAGHSAYEPGITAELVAATDRFLGKPRNGA